MNYTTYIKRYDALKAAIDSAAIHPHTYVGILHHALPEFHTSLLRRMGSLGELLYAARAFADVRSLEEEHKPQILKVIEAAEALWRLLETEYLRLERVREGGKKAPKKRKK